MAKFSIILPVRNGGEYVKECVDSILSQSVQDFDLLVLDNRSTDGTSEYFQSISDKRIKIFRSDDDLSIEKNWERIFSAPKNEFCTLIGHDDLLYPGYLTSIQALIDKYPTASLYQTHFRYIDSAGKKIRSCKPVPESEYPAEFLRRFLINDTDLMGTGFMMRSADFDRLGGIPIYPNLLFSDFELWIRLTKLNFKAAHKEECFAFRLHKSTTTMSPDIKFHHAFEQFVMFLKKLEAENKDLNAVIRENGAQFLAFYCKGLSHRLLRTPMKNREGLTVKDFIRECREYAHDLGVELKFHPESIKSLRIASMLDSGGFGRGLFLLFKKVYSKPVLD